MLNPGVKVEFDKFSLDSPFEMQYDLEGLPKHRSLYRVQLVVDTSQNAAIKVRNQLKSAEGRKLRLQLQGGSGIALFDIQTTVDSLEWMWSGEELIGEVHSAPGSSRNERPYIFPEDFDRVRGGPSMLQVTYNPGRTTSGLTARVRLVAGGER